MKTIILAVVLSLLAGCSLLPSRYSQLEEGMAQSVVQSSERTLCRDIPIGTWIRLYGASPERVKGWQSLCFNPVTAPLNDATIAALLKVYPSFQAAATAVPAANTALPPTSATGGTVR